MFQFLIIHLFPCEVSGFLFVPCWLNWYSTRLEIWHSYFYWISAFDSQARRFGVLGEFGEAASLLMKCSHKNANCEFESHKHRFMAIYSSGQETDLQNRYTSVRIGLLPFVNRYFLFTYLWRYTQEA